MGLPFKSCRWRRVEGRKRSFLFILTRFDVGKVKPSLCNPEEDLLQFRFAHTAHVPQCFGGLASVSRRAFKHALDLLGLGCCRFAWDRSLSFQRFSLSDVRDRAVRT